MNLHNQMWTYSQAAELIADPDRHCTTASLAEDLNCSTRMVSYAIGFLRHLGAPIQNTRALGYYFEEPWDFWEAYAAWLAGYPGRGHQDGPCNAVVRSAQKGCAKDSCPL